MIRHARTDEMERLLEIYDTARAFMRANGNAAQWGGGYPSREVIERDIELSQSRVVTDGGVCTASGRLDGEIVATFALIFDGEPTYDKIYDGEWLTGGSDSYIAIHRVAISVARRGSGIATIFLSQVTTTLI